MGAAIRTVRPRLKIALSPRLILQQRKVYRLMGHPPKGMAVRVAGWILIRLHTVNGRMLETDHGPMDVHLTSRLVAPALA